MIVAAWVSLSATAQTLPASVDWRERGAVTPVKNAGQCGSSWAFAATAAVEGALVVHGKFLTSLSEQEIIDCSGAYGNQGCDGGSSKAALQWIVGHGITSESAYPYTARNGSCKSGKAVVARITAVQSVKTDVASLMAAVAK
jgi:C1A family cysteine protease